MAHSGRPPAGRVALLSLLLLGVARTPPSPLFLVAPARRGGRPAIHGHRRGVSPLGALAPAGRAPQLHASRRGSAAAAAATLVDQGQTSAGVEDALLAAIDAKLAEFERKHVVDEAAALAKTPFAIAPADLIKSAKVFLAYDQGVSAPQLLAEDFKFRGPVVGPLGRDEYLAAAGSVDFAGAFPDATPEWHHFRIDPFEPNRVWMTARGQGTNSGEAGSSSLFHTPTGLSYVNPPTACSLTFTAKGQVLQYTIGHVMDRAIGNTGGLGGIYGILYAIGKPLPFPEAKPWRKSLRYRLFHRLGRALQGFKK